MHYVQPHPATPADPARVEDAVRTHIVIVGHVDHGKSTIVGRLLADTGSLPEGKLAQIRALCERTSKPFEYAFLLDALKDEQAQGITIDAARVFFNTAHRQFALIDAPGHIEFLKNMITGAARADAALLVIDAEEGLRENTRRHASMLSMLGIHQVAVLVNKMDLVGFAEERFNNVVEEIRRFMEQLGIRPMNFLPVAGRGGDNIGSRSEAMPWYTGPTVLDLLDNCAAAVPPADKPFRMAVQDVYKFTKFGDDRRIIAGAVDSGRARVGDQVVFYPSGKRSRIRSIEGFNRPQQVEVAAGSAAGLTLEEQLYVTRGEIAALAGEPAPLVTTRVRVHLFWLGREPLTPGTDYFFKLGSARVPMRVEAIERVIDASNLESQSARAHVERHQVAQCVLQLQRAVAFDLTADLAATSRFVIVDNYEISGGGIIFEGIADKESWVRDKVLERNSRWESSLIPAERRAERYSQTPALLLITGESQSDRKGLAKEVESRLFEDGRVVYFLGMGNVLRGIDADVEPGPEHRLEHFRRLGEVANLLLDAGMILVVSAAEVADDELQILRTAVADRVTTVWMGDALPTDLACDLVLSDAERAERGYEAVKRLLQTQGVIFRPR